MGGASLTPSLVDYVPMYVATQVKSEDGHAFVTQVIDFMMPVISPVRPNLPACEAGNFPV